MPLSLARNARRGGETDKLLTDAETANVKRLLDRITHMRCNSIAVTGPWSFFFLGDLPPSLD
jgi:hypothetical protein